MYIFGYKYLDIRIWIYVFGYTYLDIHIWTYIFGYKRQKKVAMIIIL